jgi:hypothetical protein
MMARANMTLTGMFVGPVLPWGVPALFGARGKLAEGPPSEVAIAVFEWPVPHWDVIGDPLAKETVERLHLERYRTDRLLATGEMPYETLDVGDDPPDFVAPQDDSRIGVDATQLTASGRIGAQAQFERIRRAVLAAPRADFTHLRGHLLYLWFRDAAGLGLPHREAEAVAEVVAALHEYRPDTSWTAVSPIIDGLPDQLGETDMQTTTSGCTFYAVELQGAVPSSQFFGVTGFEMALAFQTEHPVETAWSELSRLVDRHDKPEIDHLIVTVGGPNRRGLSYPSEAMLLDVALESGLPELAPRHLSKVVIHSWTDGRIFEVFPQTAISPSLYVGGYIAPHYSLLPPPAVHANVETTPQGKPS